MERGVSLDHRRAHDLLRVRRLPHLDDEPAWLQAAFARAPFVVVRRAPLAAGSIPVGLRGSARAERVAGWSAPSDIEAAFAPENLLSMLHSTLPQQQALPAFVALAMLRDSSSPLHDFVWGPTGSTGFELASGVATVTPSSDLDLLIRAPRRIERGATARALLQALAEASAAAGTRIDAQLETPAGGVALAEYAADKPRVLVRRIDGPVMLADPWDCRP